MQCNLSLCTCEHDDSKCCLVDKLLSLFFEMPNLVICFGTQPQKGNDIPLPTQKAGLAKMAKGILFVSALFIWNARNKYWDMVSHTKGRKNKFSYSVNLLSWEKLKQFKQK